MKDALHIDVIEPVEIFLRGLLNSAHHSGPGIVKQDVDRSLVQHTGDMGFHARFVGHIAVVHNNRVISRMSFLAGFKIDVTGVNNSAHRGK